MPVTLLYSVPDEEEATVGDEFASNQAWFSFRRWAMMESGLHALAQFCEHGASSRISKLVSETKKAVKNAPDEGLRETAKYLLFWLEERPSGTDAVGIRL